MKIVIKAAQWAHRNILLLLAYIKQYEQVGDSYSVVFQYTLKAVVTKITVIQQNHHVERLDGSEPAK